jgi:hypothetical protein
MKMSAFWDIAPCSFFEVDVSEGDKIVLMRETVCISETSVY